MDTQTIFLIGCESGDAGGGAGAGLGVGADASPQSMGFKAYNLLRMANIGLPVPPAWVLSTAYCTDEGLRRIATERSTWGPAMQSLERKTGCGFGHASRPLFVSVRSGAPVSMPGMMDTLLNIGLCDTTLHGFLRLTGNPRLVWDSYRRLVSAYGEIAGDIDARSFEKAYEALHGSRHEDDLDFKDLENLTRVYLDVYAQALGRAFPQDPVVQLTGAIEAVLNSWQSERAREYRRHEGLSESIGTAVTIQAMVFGNTGGRSGAGVGFTRDPVSGEPRLCVDFLFNAQGEDVVSGRRSVHGHQALADTLPAVWQELVEASRRLESALSDMQDIEFTVQDAQLYFLQTRNGKRTPVAGVRIALDMLDEGVIDVGTARERTRDIDPACLVETKVVSEDGASLDAAASAASANSGVAIGEIALDEARARSRQESGAHVVLVRRDAETSDIGAMELADGLLARNGVRTSHAALVARQLGKTCLVGCDALSIDEVSRSIRLGEISLREGDLLTLDGNEGRVYVGAMHTVVRPLDALRARLAKLLRP